MKLVVDANAFFAALLKDGVSRKLFFYPDFSLYSPEFIVREFVKNRAELASKYDPRAGNFTEFADAMLKHVRLVADFELTPFMPAASTLCEDEKDLLYIACALYCDAAVWSNNKRLKNQSRVRILTTSELAGELRLI